MVGGNAWSHSSWRQCSRLANAVDYENQGARGGTQCCGGASVKVRRGLAKFAGFCQWQSPCRGYWHVTTLANEYLFRAARYHFHVQSRRKRTSSPARAGLRPSRTSPIVVSSPDLVIPAQKVLNCIDSWCHCKSHSRNKAIWGSETR